MFRWVSNAVLFDLYHLHIPWVMLSIMTGSLGMTWPTRRLRSYKIGGIEGYSVVPVLAVILGLAK